MRTSPPRTRARRGLTTAATLAALLLPASAAHAATTFPSIPGDPTSASITVDRTTVSPGEWIQVSGDHFVGLGGDGVPLVTLRPYDFDKGPEWAADGIDHYTFPGTHQLEAKTWFITHQPTGTFSGRMQLPPTATPDGPPPGGLNGQHWLRVLSGAPFTSTGDNVTTPISYTVPLTVVERIRLGLTVQPGAPPGVPVPAPVYQQGTTFRPGASVTVKGATFTPGTALSVRLDGDQPANDLPGAAITTTGTGDVPDGARVTLPAGIVPGAHTLRFATGTIAHEVPITVTKAPTQTLLTPEVRPGGTVAVSVEDYVGVRGTGQKVALAIGSAALGCITADGAGTGIGTGVVPATTALGPVNLLANVGLSCIAPPAGTVDDLPNSSGGFTPLLTVSATAPTVTVPGGLQGAQVAASGEGFAPGAAASAAYRGVPLASALGVDGAGRLSGTVTLPEGVGDGALVITAGTTTAAASVTVAARPAPDPAGPGTPAGPAPTTPATPTTPTTPAQPTEPAVTAPKLGTFRTQKGGRRVRIVLKGGSKVPTTITVRSKGRVRTSRRAKAKVVTLAKRTVTKAGTYDLVLTKDGRALLRRARTTKVVVTLAPKGGKATTQTLALRRG
ncbi:hypothetical protein AB0L40_13490 [Patulibacter sp. NPDC049589]|uniref:hypothetical protein n=1 Tax=Patulibacter sp. NPDC049589 TaxID=3154731 RepID=UPI00341F2ABA